MKNKILSFLINSTLLGLVVSIGRIIVSPTPPALVQKYFGPSDSPQPSAEVVKASTESSSEFCNAPVNPREELRRGRSDNNNGMEYFIRDIDNGHKAILTFRDENGGLYQKYQSQISFLEEAGVQVGPHRRNGDGISVSVEDTSDPNIVNLFNRLIDQAIKNGDLGQDCPDGKAQISTADEFFLWKQNQNDRGN